MQGTNKNTAELNTDKDKKDPQNDTEKTVTQAHEQAEKDIEKDPDLQPDPTADLDEGELARLEGED
jgi:hypothetical protein